MNNNVFRNLSYGVYTISCQNGEKFTGCTANSVMQITSSPATLAVSLNHANYTNECIAKTGKFAVSILSEKSNPLTIGTFGFRSGRDFDKFSVIPSVMKNGLPVIEDACGYMICEVIGSFETETHTVFFAKVTDGDVMNGETPMSYAYYHNVIKGKSPKTAPTYINEG